MMPNAPEDVPDVADVADALSRLALKTPGDEHFPFLRLPNELFLDILELLQDAYIAQEERTGPHSLINLRL